MKNAHRIVLLAGALAALIQTHSGFGAVRHVPHAVYAIAGTRRPGSRIIPGGGSVSRVAAQQLCQ